MNFAWHQDGGWTGMGAPSDGQRDQGLQHTGDDDMPDWDDDDDLATMQAEPMVETSTHPDAANTCCEQSQTHCFYKLGTARIARTCTNTLRSFAAS